MLFYKCIARHFLYLSFKRHLERTKDEKISQFSDKHILYLDISDR